jgi:opacity protein-like surface antigen
MKWQIFTGFVVLFVYSFAFCAGEAYVPPNNPGQNTIVGAGYGGAGAEGESYPASLITMSILGGVSFPMSDLSTQHEIGWNVGVQALYMVYPSFYLGPSFSFNRFALKEKNFTFIGTDGIPVAGLNADGFSWLTDFGFAFRFTPPLDINPIAPFLQIGAGWFHFRQEVDASGVTNVLSVQEDRDGFASTWGLGVSFLVDRNFSIDLFPAFHFNVSSNHSPIDFFTTNLAFTAIF